MTLKLLPVMEEESKAEVASIREHPQPFMPMQIGVTHSPAGRIQTVMWSVLIPTILS